MDVEEELGDEDDERLLPFDPLYFHEGYSESISKEAAELHEQRSEEDFNSRVFESIGGPILLEMYTPKYSGATTTWWWVRLRAALPRPVTCLVGLQLLKSEALDITMTASLPDRPDHRRRG